MLREFTGGLMVMVAVAGTCAGEPEADSELVITSFDTVDDWPGLRRDTRTVKRGPASGKWSAMEGTPGVGCSAIPHDWSEYNVLSLWVYNRKRLESTAFMMIVWSEREETEGADYYTLRFDLGKWEGWKRFLVPLGELGSSRKPVGWHKIDRINFAATGWENTPNPEAVVYFDDFRLLRQPKIEGPRLSDEEFFLAMNLDYPGLEAVKAAVGDGNLEAAKIAWLEHLKTRTCPRWYIDWRDRPKQKKRPPAGVSEAWDYLAHGIPLDWTGWKHFRLEKPDFQAFGRPVGWRWISFIAINAADSGRTPNPKTVLHFDDMRLVSRQKRVSVGDFEDGLNHWQGLTQSRKQAKSGRFSGKWDQTNVNTSVRLGELPTDWSEFDALEFWCYSPRATGATLTMVLGSGPPLDVKADEICKHIIGGHDFGPDIDWSADPDNFREWTHVINRFYHWQTLCEAYWATGEEKYAKEFCDQLLDWVHKNPVPLSTSGRRTHTWRTIECGIRQSGTWPDCLYRVLGSESFTPQVAAVMTKSMVEHARHLMAWPSSGNWLAMECNGLGTIGILLPEFKEADQWRRTALARQYAELDNQVYPDGAQIELTTGYHQVSLRNFLGLARTAKLNGIPLAEDYHAKLRRMFEYNLLIQMPNARTPGLNDGGMGSIVWSMETAYELYEDPVFDWAASRGARGTPPERTSHFFPYAGQMVMRSGWEPDARYLLMDAGPFGYSHGHEDKLGIVVHALGKLHVIDPGNYRYDFSPWRRYTADTAAHNTVMVDGLPQRRRGKPRSQYIVAEPLPTNLWLTSDKLDYGAGQYDEGYGDQHEVKIVHRREVVFVKPDYWLVVDTLTGQGEHLFESLFHFDADEAEIDPDGSAVRTIDPSPNCLIAAAAQPGLELRIVKGQTEPEIQGFVAARKWRPSWKDPEATPPEHGKREIPTAIFALRGEPPVRMIYVIYPFAEDEKPRVKVEDATEDNGPVRARITLPSGTVDEIILQEGVKVVRTPPGGRPKPWASLKTDQQPVLPRGVGLPEEPSRRDGGQRSVYH